MFFWGFFGFYNYVKKGRSYDTIVCHIDYFPSTIISLPTAITLILDFLDRILHGLS